MQTIKSEIMLIKYQVMYMVAYISESKSVSQKQ